MAKHKTHESDVEPDDAPSDPEAHKHNAPDLTLRNLHAADARLDKLEATVRSLVDIVKGLKGSGYHPYDVTPLD